MFVALFGQLHGARAYFCLRKDVPLLFFWLAAKAHRAWSSSRRPSGSSPDMAQHMRTSTSAILDTEALLRRGERRRPCAASTRPSSVWTPIVRPPFSAACTAYSTYLGSFSCLFENMGGKSVTAFEFRSQDTLEEHVFATYVVHQGGW